MYHPVLDPPFLPPGVKGVMFSLCSKNSSLYTTHGGFGNGSQVRRIVTQSLRVPCEWMQRRMTSMLALDHVKFCGQSFVVRVLWSDGTGTLGKQRRLRIEPEVALPAGHEGSDLCG